MRPIKKGARVCVKGLPPVILVRSGHGYLVIGIEVNEECNYLIVVDSRASGVISENGYESVIRLNEEGMEKWGGWEVLEVGGEELRRWCERFFRKRGREEEEEGKETIDGKRNKKEHDAQIN